MWENQNYADEFLASNTHKVARPSSLATTPVLQVMRSRSFQDYLLKVSTQRKISRLWKFLYPIGKYSFLSNQRTLPNKFDKDEKNHLKVSFSWLFGVFWGIFAHFLWLLMRIWCVGKNRNDMLVRYQRKVVLLQSLLGLL